MSVDLVILGAGWTSTFLIPLCEECGIQVAATSRSGRGDTIPFIFNPESNDTRPYEALPDTKTILISFPIKTIGGSQRLVAGYLSTRKAGMNKVGFIQLGATSIWDRKRNVAQDGNSPNSPWCDRNTPHNQGLRASCEDELLALAPETSTTVLNLAGLWGGLRLPRNWVERVGLTKDALRQKGSVHFIHGIDVARAILAVHYNFSHAVGQRWLLTDARVYDWWDLASAWGTNTNTSSRAERKENEISSTDAAIHNCETQPAGPQREWVKELMIEQGIRALPRDINALGRALDSRDFWESFGLFPVKALLEG
ncbi:hypothetical protein Ac2012v2_002252 [Leucoagaricus gongylophorus]